MSHSHDYSSFRPESAVDETKTFFNHLSTRSYEPEYKSEIVDGTIFPLEDFTQNFYHQPHYWPVGETGLSLSPLCNAAYRGLNDDLVGMFPYPEKDDNFQLDLDFALFLALLRGHVTTADFLIRHGANPGRDMSSNGLHGAARRGLQEQMRQIVSHLKVPVDVEDASGATAVMYAMQRSSPSDWKTIKFLFDELGAKPEITIGENEWTYEEYARAMGKDSLADQLEEAANSAVLEKKKAELAKQLEEEAELARQLEEEIEFAKRLRGKACASSSGPSIDNPQSFPGYEVTYPTMDATPPGAVYPLSAFKTDDNGTMSYLPQNCSFLRFSPMSYAAFKDSTTSPELLRSYLIGEQRQQELDFALFLAVYEGNENSARFLLDLGANPGRESSLNGMHAAARRGQTDLIRRYHKDFKAQPDVRDETSATPILYAMQLDAPDDWNTIKYLLGLEASAKITFGNLTYGDFARLMGKEDLAARLYKLADDDGSTIFASSRELSKELQ
ncbi:hypothetical protein ED733_000363 [Metarhizium rileyi]|uniref:Ankyrin repeat-containing domain protein n=1 Tax=Metarhizium rileyi (strain RCEF 4871) TaxID=1649241 RepID=A0A5C6FZU0_METRR|nr:hypothetical protein ED733_000363 [Metarhizium rileyi]